MSEFCEVAVPVPLDMVFTYRVPTDSMPVIGGRVLVPFRQQRMTGIVVELEDHTNSNGSNAGGGQGSAFTGQQLTNEMNWYSSMASTYASNPYVWFGSDNELMRLGDLLLDR